MHVVEPIRMNDKGAAVARSIVASLLEDRSITGAVELSEASVHLPARGRNWIAAFTGPVPGQQIWRSTKLTNKAAALALAQRWEEQARQARASQQPTSAPPRMRVRRRRAREPGEPLSQKEVALLLNPSER